MKILKSLLVSLALLGTAFSAEAQSAPPVVTLNTSVSSGAAPLAVTVTWSATNTVGATPCVASGLWSGSKATSGSQVVTVNATGAFNLSCNGSVESAVVVWTNPTTNTDGSTLTDLASLKVYTSKDNITYVVSATVLAPATTTTISTLTAGVTYFKMTAVNAGGTESAYSTIAQKTLQTLSGSASKSITINTVPNPPSGVTVTVATAYAIKNGKPDYVVGVIPLGTPCLSYLGKKWGVDFYSVAGQYVTPPMLGPVAAQCG